MGKPEFEFHIPTEPWTPAGFKTDGISQQIMATDPDTGNYTRRVKFLPGTDTSADGILTHDFWEEVYVVEGDITDLRLNQTFTAGMYSCRPPGMPHGPWRSQNGVLFLEFRYGFPQ